MNMKVKTIHSGVAGNIEADIGRWLRDNPEAEPQLVTQVHIGERSIMTTILYTGKAQG